VADNTSVPKITLPLDRGDRLEAIVLPARKKELSRAELQRALAPIVATWLKATCLWDDTSAIGDHRFLVFAINVAPNVQVYVQFWSEPFEAVLWEVSSGKWNPPADKWLEGDRSRRIEAFGFEPGGEAENYQKEVDIRTPAEASRVARTVVDLMYAGFDYRGLKPVKVYTAYESRAESRFAYDSFTTDDLSKIFRGAGFKVQEVDGDEDVPVLRAVRRGITTSINPIDKVEDQQLFRRMVLTADIEVPPEGLNAAREAVVQAAGGPPDSVQVGTTLTFAGGVTVEWLVMRVQEWDQMTWRCRRDTRRRKAIPAAAKDATVH